MSTFIVNFETNVKETIRKYDLIKKKDRVIVACSGGKDSTTVLYLLKKFGYDVEALIIDLGIGDWSKKSVGSISAFCNCHNIKLHVIKPVKEIEKGNRIGLAVFFGKTRLIDNKGFE